ncbi:hypothetical protein GCM10022279_13530 [Comamonas faecalis]|uniref:C-type lysozyme inhibitor domain-containing protein n=1 Tax=Comamonas faecalis TaxID=1387849 RepID=A0ABP7R4R4_9BURK
MRTASTLVLAATTVLAAACSTVVQVPQQPITYRCDSGRAVTASYPDTDTATVDYQGTRHAMQIAVSASGARYTGDGYEWWTKGAEGTLFGHNADGTTGERIELCAQR